MNPPSKRRLRERANAARNRRELVAAGFTRRELLEMGLVTAAGSLITTKGLSARARDSSGEQLGQTFSPPTTPFCEPLPILAGPDAAPGRVHQPIAAGGWTIGGPHAAMPQAGEGRTKHHQALSTPVCVPQLLYETRQCVGNLSVSPDLPEQELWGYNGLSPGPTFICRYGTPILVRNINDLPADNGGFGIPSVTTHLHNGHTPAESDGFPCDYFERGQFYDQHYPNVHAGFSNPSLIPAAFRDPLTGGDYRESLSTLWYHDHRVDFTSQNAYKGLAGFYLMYNQFDTGDETTGFHLPSGRFDVPLMIGDRVFDPSNGKLFFDLFNLDGIVADKFLVNGVVQPHFKVHPRRYRFRLLASGPSRFYQFHLLDAASPTTIRPFWQISSDGNLLPKPLFSTGVRLGVAERTDIIIDFTGMAGKTLYLENRLEQLDGRGPTGVVKPAGAGDKVMRFDVELPDVGDTSANPATAIPDPATGAVYYPVPTQGSEPTAVTRTFNFERGNGQWQVNGKFMNCDGPPRFKILRGSGERWRLRNSSGGWEHPIHTHFEEFQMLKRNGSRPPVAERGRKDVARLGRNEVIETFSRFRDFTGRYPLHCHNTVHEDHSMMLVFEISDVGDTKAKP